MFPSAYSSKIHLLKQTQRDENKDKPKDSMNVFKRELESQDI